MLRARLLLILALMLALAPIPVLRVLGGDMLERLQAIDEQQRTTAAITTFATNLRSVLTAELRRGTDLALDDPTRLAIDLAGAAYDEPAILSLAALREPQPKSARDLSLLDPLASALRDHAKPDVRMLGLILAARVLTAEGRSDLAARLADPLRELDPAGLSPEARRHRECVIVEGEEHASRLDAWLTEIESRASSLAELSHLLDAIGPDDPARCERARRIANRAKIAAAITADLARHSLPEGGPILLDTREGCYAVAGDRANARFLAPEIVADLLHASGAQVDFAPDTVALPSPLVGSEVALLLTRPALALSIARSSLFFGQRPERLLDAALGIYALLVVALGILMLRTQRRTEALATLQSDLVAQITHELRTPLTVLRMYGESLAAGRVAPGAREEYVRTMSVEAERLGKLVDRVAAAAREDDASASEMGAAVDAFAVVREIGTVYTRALADGGGSLTITVDDGTADVPLDAEDLRLALDVLLDNAVAYGRRDNAPPRLELSALRSTDEIVIVIRDHGPGVLESDRKHLFERFTRLDSARRSRRRGAGMGLYLARRIARSAGGDVVLQFPAEGGTRAVITLKRWRGGAG